jgi:hypothetical protein
VALQVVLFTSHFLIRRTLLRSAHTMGHVAGMWSGNKPFCVYAQDPCCRDSMQAGAHKADWGIKMCCSGKSNLQEQCTRCNIENWGHFVPASWRMNSNQLNFMQQKFFTKTGMSHKENWCRSMSLLHVLASCLLLCANLYIVTIKSSKIVHYDTNLSNIDSSHVICASCKCNTTQCLV